MLHSQYNSQYVQYFLYGDIDASEIDCLKNFPGEIMKKTVQQTAVAGFVLVALTHSAYAESHSSELATHTGVYLEGRDDFT